MGLFSDKGDSFKKNPFQWFHESVRKRIDLLQHRNDGCSRKPWHRILGQCHKQVLECKSQLRFIHYIHAIIHVLLVVWVWSNLLPSGQITKIIYAMSKRS